MPDLHERFASAEQIPGPDLWDDVQWRAISAPVLQLQRPSTGRRAVTILVAFAIFAAAVLGFGQAFRSSVDAPASPAPSPHRPAPPQLLVGSALPVEFTDTIELPAGVHPVASRSCCGYVQVWFQSDRPIRDLEPFFDHALRRHGWSTSRQGSELGGAWRYFASSKARAGVERTAVVIGRSAGTSKLMYGSDAFDEAWDLYIIVYG